MESNSRISRREDEDEDETWIPLPANNGDDDDDPSLISERDRIAWASSATSQGRSSRASLDARPPSQRSANASSKSSKSDNLQVIQRRLETRVAVQNNLVNHPIDMFWKRFLVNLVREVWTLEVRIRCGLLMLLVGLVTRIFVWSTWYILYPRVALSLIVVAISLIYFDPFELQGQLKSVLDVILSPDKAVQAIERLDLKHVRRLSFFLFLVPTFLEMRTLSFLSQIKAEAGYNVYNLGIGCSLLFTMVYLMKVKGMKSRDATYQGMLIAYGSALLITLYTFDIRRMPFLAAPFFTATGTLLLTYQDEDMEWISRTIRHTLRLTLRDVLSSVGERVTEDEMLQLAILRWIADFWASNPGTSTAEHEPTSAPSDANSDSPEPPSSSERSDPQSRPTSAGTNAAAAAATTTTTSTSAMSTYQRNDVQWEELLPMLNIEIDHMEGEVEALQNDNHTPGGQSGGQTSASSSTTTSSQRQQQAQEGSPFDALKSMLLDLNVDNRAKPAVMAYKRAVESFPPQKRTAVAISVLRRCPALLTLAFHIFVGGTKSLFTSFLILVPFIVMEYCRILEWMKTCNRVGIITSGLSDDAEEHIDSGIPKQLQNVDTMVILLCGDHSSVLNPPTLLLVWHNIMSSVSALEVGLTAARCAETTAVAVDFAGNVMSLVQFGYEISQHGLLYGLGIVVKEAVSIHGAGGNISNLDGMDDEAARYTRAAIRAVHSGQKVAQNIHILSEDQHVGAIMQPLLGVLGLLSGQGWLWGKDDEVGGAGTSSGSASSTGIVIEELLSEENDPTRPHEENQQAPSTVFAELEKSEDEPVPCNQDKKEELESTSSLPSTPHAQKQKDEELILNSSSPQDELSSVMEMVATAYEQNLIEESEKADFLLKLSKLHEDELFDPLVLSSMKRTLNIILENGSMTSPADDDTNVHPARPVLETTGNEKVDTESAETYDNAIKEDADMGTNPTREVLDSTPSLDRLRIDEVELDPPSQQVKASPSEAEVHESQTGDDNALLKFGVAALGVVAGGIFLSMAGGDRGTPENGQQEETRSSVSEDNRDEQVGNQSSTVVIEELNDDDNDWVSVPQ